MRHSSLKRVGSLSGSEEHIIAIRRLEEKIEQSQKLLLQHQIHLKWSIIETIDRAQGSEICCPLCAHKDSLLKFRELVSNCIFEGGTLVRHQCPNCDVIFGPQKILNLNPESLSKEYEWHYKVFSEGDSREQEVRAFRALRPTKHGTYLNWGAGAWSKTIDHLRREGWNVYGYEPNTVTSQGNPYILTTKEQLSNIQFDGIFSNNVLEHLRNPVDELILMRTLLKDGGKLSHATPCFEYLYEFTRFHLFFFLGRSRKLLAEKAGFDIESYETDQEYKNLVLFKR